MKIFIPFILLTFMPLSALHADTFTLDSVSSASLDSGQRSVSATNGQYIFVPFLELKGFLENGSDDRTNVTIQITSDRLAPPVSGLPTSGTTQGAEEIRRLNLGASAVKDVLIQCHQLAEMAMNSPTRFKLLVTANITPVSPAPSSTATPDGTYLDFKRFAKAGITTKTETDPRVHSILLSPIQDTTGGLTYSQELICTLLKK